MKNRDAFYDNAKFILIVLVVFSHFGFEQRGNLHMHAILNLMTAFVVPCYALISGYFSKKITSQRKEDVFVLLIPYLILETINFLYTRITGMGEGNKYLLIPTYQNWYLLSLFFWRLLIPYFRFMKPNQGIALSIALALTVGFIPQFEAFLALYRTLYLMPFFVIGYYMKDLKSSITDLKRYRYLMMIIFFGILGTMYYLTVNSKEMADKILYLFAPMYGYLGEFNNFILRILAFVVIFVLIFTFMVFVPNRTTKFTELGKQTMVVYLFHMFILWPIIPIIAPYKPVVSELIAIAGAVSIALILSIKMVVKALNPIVNPVEFIKQFKNKIK
jgi:fucose 4-O-acetylase-like acetyltransferase